MNRIERRRGLTLTYTGRPRVIFNLLPEAPPRLGKRISSFCVQEWHPFEYLERLLVTYPRFDILKTYPGAASDDSRILIALSSHKLVVGCQELGPSVNLF